MRSFWRLRRDWERLRGRIGSYSQKHPERVRSRTLERIKTTSCR
jgi:hypothetical protein